MSRHDRAGGRSFEKQFDWRMNGPAAGGVAAIRDQGPPVLYSLVSSVDYRTGQTEV